MNPERHAQVKEIFLQACDLPAYERVEFLSRRCGGDKELQAEVERLLGFHVVDAPVEVAAPAPVPDRVLEPGALITDRYRIVALVGRGGMGTVYRADDTRVGQPVALKFLPTAVAADPEWRRRLYGEVRLAREVTHANVCRIFDVSEADGDPFISMEYVSGEDLKSLLHRIGRLPAEKALEMARWLCAGLAAAHARGVLHRDLKPANVMLDENGQVKITDFGLACRAGGIDPRERLAGTPPYMAPEQLMGGSVTVRSDIYSLGLILYELFTGRPAFRAATLAELVAAKANPPPAPSQWVNDLDPAVESVILQCLEPDPRRRPDSVLAVAAALPGGDLLSAALTAGVIPTPDMVVAAGTVAPLPWARTAVALGVFLVLLLATVVLSPWVHPLTEIPTAKPPDVLADKAGEIVRQLRPGVPPSDDAYGYMDHLQVDTEAEAPDEERSGFRYAPVDAAAVAFRYRAGDSTFLPADPVDAVLSGGQFRPRDLPAIQRAVTVVLDLQGNLLGLEAAMDVPRPGRTSMPAADWPAFFMLAGLDITRFGPANPRLDVPAGVDRRLAWIGTRNPGDGGEMRVEAAADEGQPVFFAVVRPNSPELGPAIRRNFLAAGRDGLLCLLVFAAFPLAWRNLTRGRGDPRGTFCLAAFIFATGLLVWLLPMPWVAGVGPALHWWALATIGALVEAALAGLFYLAMEPYVRQFWPQTILSWSRLMTGRFHDPRVGHDLLLGSILGVSWALMFRLDRWAAEALRLPLREPIRAATFFTNLLGPRQALAAALDILREAMYEGLILLLLLVLLRILLRRPWLTAMAAVVALAGLILPLGAHPAVSWFFVGVGCVVTAVWALTRFGLVPIITSLFVCLMLVRFPLTLDLRAWYADLSLFALLVVLAVAGFGAISARHEHVTAPNSLH